MMLPLPSTATFGGIETPPLDSMDPFPGLSSPRGWDERKGYGTSGSTEVFKGLEIAKFSMKGLLWTADHYSYYIATFLPAIMLVPSGRMPKAWDLIHPLVQAMGITAVNVAEPVALKQQAPGLWVWEVKLHQFRRPAPALATPKSSKSGAQEDPRDKELRNVADQLGKEGDDLDRNLRRIGV